MLPTASSGPLGSALSAAVSSSLSQNIVEVVGQGGAAPLTSLQIHFIQNMIHETLEDFRYVPDKHHCQMCVVTTMIVSPLKGHLSQGHRQPAGGDGPTVLHPAGENLCLSMSVGMFYLSEDTTKCGFAVFQNEIHSLIERYSVNESLVEEIERLKEENRRLKTNY